jgi:hypothetical protein
MRRSGSMAFDAPAPPRCCSPRASHPMFSKPLRVTPEHLDHYGPLYTHRPSAREIKAHPPWRIPSRKTSKWQAMAARSASGSVAHVAVRVAVSWAGRDPESPFARMLYLQIARKERADERTRTADLLITSELLYQLSYVGLFRAQSISQGCPAFTRVGLTQRSAARSMLTLFFDGLGVPGRRSM